MKHTLVIPHLTCAVVHPDAATASSFDVMVNLPHERAPKTEQPAARKGSNIQNPTFVFFNFFY